MADEGGDTKKRRGRPAKVVAEPKEVVEKPKAEKRARPAPAAKEDKGEAASPAKRGRGRPPGGKKKAKGKSPAKKVLATNCLPWT